MKYTKEQKDAFVKSICDRISEGESLRSVLRSDNMINKQTFLEWVDSNEEYGDQYAQAKEARADHYFEDMHRIASEEQPTTEIISNNKGEVTEITKDNVQSRRLQIDTLKWMLARMNSKKYGDKVDITSDGERINQPVLNISIDGEEMKLK